ncbi:signal peptidase I [Isoptericola sp. G70]|uniref:signal peptidase I n=1 Tax=Isoptericola sp. G70 TaxID=3376633 RepID=UPI003A8095F7
MRGDLRGRDVAATIDAQDTAVAPDGPSADAARVRGAVLSGLWAGFTYGLLGLTVLLAAVVIVVPKMVGGVPLTILSGSMEPNLPAGSLAVVRPVDTDHIRLGDIVTYLPNPGDPTAITHRVTSIDHHQDGTRSFTLQGDANATPDAPVRDLQVRGRVWYAVPWLGQVNSVVNGEQRTLAVFVVAGALFVWAAVLWTRAWRGRRRSRAPVP